MIIDGTITCYSAMVKLFYSYLDTSPENNYVFHAAGRYRRFCMIQNPPGTLNSRPSTYKSNLG
jgi:hypothetical protein